MARLGVIIFDNTSVEQAAISHASSNNGTSQSGIVISILARRQRIKLRMGTPRIKMLRDLVGEHMLRQCWKDESESISQLSHVRIVSSRL